MGLRAIDAVQRHSQFRHDDDDNSNFMGYRIMIAIAWYADDNGVAGVAGDHTKCPSINTLAGRANVHRNSILNWLPRLVQAGELATEKHGAGRGAHIVYSILLPMELVPIPDIGTSDYENDTRDSTGDVPIASRNDDVLVQEMSEIRQLLVHQSELLVQVMAQAIGTNGTRDSTGDVLDSYDPLFDPEDDPREGVSPPPPLFTGAWFEQNSVPPPSNDEERALVEHPAASLWIGLTDRWPTYSGLRQIAKRLGPSPDTAALQEAWDLWKASNYNLNNVGGILDRYDAAKGRVQSGPNGRHPSGKQKDDTTAPV